MFDLGLIKKDEPALLDDLLGLFSQNLKRPNLLTYLEADVDTILNRISLRNRSTERNIDGLYIEKLQQRFNEMIYYWKVCPIFTVDATRYSIINHADLNIAKELGSWLISKNEM